MAKLLLESGVLLSLQVRVARSKPLLRAAGKKAAAAAAAVASNAAPYANGTLAGTSETAAAGPIMLGVKAVAGVHHFSGSWLGLDGSRSLSLRKEVTPLIVDRFSFFDYPF